MIDPARIPDALVEAAARHIARTMNLGPDYRENEREAKATARAALAAGLSALLADEEAMTRGGLAAFDESEAPAIARAVLLAAMQEAER